MVDEVETVEVETAVLMMVAHRVEIVVRVRKETDHREIGHVVEIVVHVHRAIDPSVRKEIDLHAQQVIVVRVRKETDHRVIAVRVRKETDRHAQWVIVAHVLRATCNLVLNRHLETRRLRTRLPPHRQLHRHHHPPHQRRMLVLLRASRGVSIHVIGTVTYKIPPTTSWAHEG